MVERIELPAQSRRPRAQQPSFIIIHTTQGKTTAEKQYQATVNWFRMAGGRPPSDGWGPSCDILIGSKGEEAFFTLNDQDFHKTRANWSAGYGASLTTFGADEYGISIEVAQTDKGERPTDAALKALVGRCAYLCITFGIEPKRITLLTQLRHNPIPSGLVGHEDTANGRKTGKVDPGKNFPWEWFIDELKKEIAARTTVTPPKVGMMDFKVWEEFWANGAEPIETKDGRHYYRVSRKVK